MLLLWHSMGILVCTTRHSKKNIVIVTPATLLATLRLIDSMWTNQSSKKTLEIARQAGALYDKFEGFVGDLIKIGKNRRKAKQNTVVP
jgi:DNA recombination protein RmuC